MKWRNKRSSGSGCSAKSELAQAVMVELEAEPFAGFKPGSIFSPMLHPVFTKTRIYYVFPVILRRQIKSESRTR